MPNLCSLLRENIHLAKAELITHVHELVLTPKQTNAGPVYEVTGDWKLLPEKECVIWLVARDGIEPPTPAFSVSGCRAITTTYAARITLRH